MTTVATAAAQLATAALAQNAPARPDQAPRGQASVKALEEVVVTARRREERLQDVPVAVTVLSGQAIQQANIARMDELQRVAPGFSVTPAPFGNGPLAPTIRSMRQPLSNITYDQSVNTYFAEVVQARPIGLNTAFFDIANVQVLKGPQGTLFGRNSPGGAILITPEPPTTEFGGYLRGVFGNYNTHNFEGALNVPASDALQVRLSARINRRDGYTKSLSTGNQIDNDRSEAARLSIHFAPPGSGFWTTAVIDYLHEEDAGGEFRLLEVNPAGLVARLYPVQAELALMNAHGFRATTAATPEDGTRIKSWGASVISGYEFNDNLSIKNIFGYRKVDSHLQFDLDGTRYTIVDGTDALTAEQYSDELQLIGKAFDGNLDYIFGVYGFRERGPDPQVTLAFSVPAYNNLFARNKSASIFGQATYRIPAVQGLSFTFGGRQTWDSRYMNLSAYRGTTCTLLDADIGGRPLNPCFREASADFNKFTYTMSLDYKVTNDILVYIAHRTGYRSGGFAAAPKLPSEFTPYRPEEASDVELGLKATWRLADTVGRTNLALYTTKYTDIQRSFSFFEGQVAKSTIINAADARIRGLELEQMWRPIPSVEFNIGYALSDAKYETFITPDGRNYSNAPFSGAPKHQVTGSIRWELPTPTEAGEFAVQINGAYRSETVGIDVVSFNPVTQQVIPQLVIPAYHTFDARLDWTNVMGRKGLSAAFWMRNFTNEEYVTAKELDWTVLGIQSGLLGPPRTYGVELSYAF
jgi:iron complex outermembrane receptor protein